MLLDRELLAARRTAMMSRAPDDLGLLAHLLTLAGASEIWFDDCHLCNGPSVMVIWSLEPNHIYELFEGTCVLCGCCCTNYNWSEHRDVVAPAVALGAANPLTLHPAARGWAYRALLLGRGV